MMALCVCRGAAAAPHCVGFVGSDCSDLVAPPPGSALEFLSIVSCCSSLCEVYTDRLGPGLCVPELHELPARTCLCLSYTREVPHDSVVECVGGLAAVPKLRGVDTTWCSALHTPLV
jgi:hypothetical protein